MIKLSVLYFILFYLCFNLCHAQTTEYKIFYYANGVKSSEGTLVDGKPDGYWKTYSEKGILKSEGNRKSFLLDSIWKFYDEKGNLTQEIFYREGKKNGSKKVYDIENNYLKYQENYLNDIKEGLTKYYYPNAKLKEQIPYKNNLEDGIGYEYNEEGIIISVVEYKAGFIKKRERINRKDSKDLKQGNWKEFYDDMFLKNECYYLDNKKNGYYKEYDRKGSLINTIKYVNDSIIKDAPELQKLEVKNQYYQGGKIKYSGTYKGELAEGTHREFDTAGKVTNAKIFKDGLLVGEGIIDVSGKEQGKWREYHENGQIKSVGEYKDGKRIGLWEFYHANGKIEQKGLYDKYGKAQGNWKWYHENAKILREENYENNLRNGEMIEYDEAGKIITKGQFIDGLKENKWIYEIGDYKEEGMYKDDLRSGIWKHYYLTNNEIKFVGNYIDGNEDGEHKYYYPDKKIKIIGKYSMGLKEGDWKYFNETGIETLVINYKEGKEVSINGVKIKEANKEENINSNQ